MADDLTIDPGDPSGPNIATDEIGGKHYQRVKMTWGPNSSANEVDASTPMPIDQAPIDGIWKVYKTAAFTSGPVTLDVNADLARNATKLYVVCIGPGAITIETTKDSGSPTWGDPWPLEAGETLSVDGLLMDRVRVNLDDVLASAYKILAV